MLIKTVANSRFGEASNEMILLSIFVPDVFNSSISVGVSEKNADSAAETNAATTNRTSIEIIANTILTEKDLTMMLLSNGVFDTKCKLLGISKMLSFFKQ